VSCSPFPARRWHSPAQASHYYNCINAGNAGNLAQAASFSQLSTRDVAAPQHHVMQAVLLVLRLVFFGVVLYVRRLLSRLSLHCTTRPVSAAMRHMHVPCSCTDLTWATS
jgi:hypothetical protein